MMTKRDNYLIAARGGKPDWVPCYPDDCCSYFPEFWKEVDPVTGADFCNVRWVENDFGKMPDERYPAMQDIHQWRETVKFPNLAAIDWDEERRRFLETCDPDKAQICRLNTHGIFLIPINMLGWVEGLSAIYEEPEELEAFVSAITDFLVELVDYECRYFHPDIVFTGDDVAAANGPLISKKTWDTMYAPYFRKIIDAIHSYGALAEFHCCGNCGYLIEEFLAVGTDICQLPVPNDDLMEVKRRLGSKFVMSGGWDRKGPAAMPGASEEVVRQSVHTALDTWGRDGGLIFWDGGIAGTSEDSQNKRRWLYDEFNRYKYELYAK